MADLIICGNCGRECIPDGDCYGCEVDRLRPVYDAAVEWRVLERWYSAHTRGALIRAIDAAKGK